MRRIVSILSLLIFSTLLVSAQNIYNEETYEKVDEIPLEVKIGEQVWMTKNLEVRQFQNGDDIPLASTAKEWELSNKMKQPAYCYNNKEAKNGEKYGLLYNWYAVSDSRGLAPDGWHIATDEEWSLLEDTLGGEEIAADGLKSTNGWATNLDMSSGNGSNHSGFHALPGGFRWAFPGFEKPGSIAAWWTVTQKNNSQAFHRQLYNDGRLLRGFPLKGYGLSVRCVRD